MWTLAATTSEAAISLGPGVAAWPPTSTSRCSSWAGQRAPRYPPPHEGVFVPVQLDSLPDHPRLVYPTKMCHMQWPLPSSSGMGWIPARSGGPWPKPHHAGSGCKWPVGALRSPACHLAAAVGRAGAAERMRRRENAKDNPGHGHTYTRTGSADRDGYANALPPVIVTATPPSLPSATVTVSQSKSGIVLLPLVWQSHAVHRSGCCPSDQQV